MANDYEIIKQQQRLQQERTGIYDDPWKFAREREPKQRGCNCKHDPARQKGTCGTCGGWVG